MVPPFLKLSSLDMAPLSHLLILLKLASLGLYSSSNLSGFDGFRTKT